jgi:hypothetical protein
VALPLDDHACSPRRRQRAGKTQTKRYYYPADFVEPRKLSGGTGARLSPAAVSGGAGARLSPAAAAPPRRAPEDWPAPSCLRTGCGSGDPRSAWVAAAPRWDYSAANRSKQREQRDGRGCGQGLRHASSRHRIVKSVRPLRAPTFRRQSSLFSLLSPVPSASLRRSCSNSDKPGTARRWRAVLGGSPSTSTPRFSGPPFRA